jgi:hypothetical protein
MRRSPVLDAIKKSTWTLIQMTSDEGPPSYLRLREPVLSATETGSHRHLLQVLWAYADEDSGAMPTEADADAMKAFEDLLCKAWEHDGLAILTAVLTFDGARQWIFYTHDVNKCAERLEGMPQQDEPYPVELTTRPDPGWMYLRDEVLAAVELPGRGG